MREFLLVGAGQLGSRHLQALAQFDAADMAISVVDPSPAALELARERLAQVTTSSRLRAVRYLPALADVPADRIDFAVIATGANCRLAVLRELLATRAVRALLLEKVLFQSVAELDEASALLAASAVPAWVNCPRRQFPGYRTLRDRLAGEGALRLQVAGHNWGLACNAIHFIDLWAFLSGRHDYRLDAEGLGASFPSKRPGFLEIAGRLAGGDGETRFELAVSVDEAPASVQVDIDTEHFAIVVEEAAGRCRLTRKGDGAVEDIAFPVLFQSQLTHLVATAALAGGAVPLTPFAESAALHRPLLAALLGAFRRQDPALARCPIT